MLKRNGDEFRCRCGKWVERKEIKPSLTVPHTKVCWECSEREREQSEMQTLSSVQHHD